MIPGLRAPPPARLIRPQSVYNHRMGRYTCQLFASPGWASGAARILDIGGTFDLYNESPTSAIADTRALAADFMAVAEDFDAALSAVTGRR